MISSVLSNGSAVASPGPGSLPGDPTFWITTLVMSGTGSPSAVKYVLNASDE